MKALPLYEPLSPAEVEAIDQAALRVLEEVGIEARDQEILELYRRAEARIEGSRVFLPGTVVQREVRRAPAEVVLCGRDPRHDLRLTGTNVHVGTGGAALDVLDLDTGEARPARLQDVADLALLVENLENIHFFLRPCEPRDVPLDRVDVNKYYAAFTHTTKHVMGSVHGLDGLRQSLELAALVSGGPEAYRQRPILSFIGCWMVSPLTLEPAITRVILEAVRQHAPVVLSTAPMAGSTSPLTLAGTLVQTHAELLSGIALTQIAAPGAPVLYGAVPSLSNLRTGRYLGGPIEFGMLQAAAAQLARAWK
ncbi:MAG: trimethylamine methyltransferase family protein, partial [Armatimonadetes bacterium]|nr:trimethylamine methyltransferase family protein [Armatimonadota bacterium]